MLLYSYIASPFVAHIHLHLPAYVRHSHELLLRYVRSLPADAKLEFTTMNSIGIPRVTPVKVSDLRPVKERLGMVNYVAKDVFLEGPQRWRMANRRQFGVHGGDKIQGRFPGMWNDIVKLIERRKK